MVVRRRTALSVLVVAALAGTLVNASAAQAAKPAPPIVKSPVAVGRGGAVATVDLDATRVGLEVLRRGGNAADAAVAAAATLGVTEPFSSGIGGGGFFVFYNRHTKTVETIDGREAAPASMQENAFINPATGLPFEFQEARVSGISVGVPGSPLTWQAALQRWGTMSLRDALAPAIEVADLGFVVDQTFFSQVNDNLAAFSQFSSTCALYLPNGQPPAVGSTFRNPDLAQTYRLLAQNGVGVLYRGEVARDIVATVQDPPRVDTPPVASSHAHELPRLRRLRDADPVQRRLDGRRGAEHRRELGSRRPVAGAGITPVPGGERPGLRRPQPVRGRRHAARAARRAAQPEVRPGARLPHRHARASQAGRAWCTGWGL